MFPYGNLSHGLVGAFAFDGPTCVDLSNWRRNGSHNGTLQTTRGIRGVTVSGGTTISLSGTPPITSQDFSVSAWVYTAGLSGGYSSMFEFAQAGTGNRDIAAFLAVDGSISLMSIGVTAISSSPVWVTVGQWTHCGVTRQGSEMRLYRNGLVMSTHANMGGTTQYSGAVWRFGNNVSGGGGHWNGAYADIRLWRRALGADEMAVLASRPGIGLAPARHRRSVLAAAGAAHWINVGGTWKQATTHLNVGGTWKQATPSIKVAGTWK